MKHVFRKSLKPMLLTTALAALLSSGTAAFAHGYGGMMGDGHGPCHNGMQMGMMDPGMGMDSGMGMMGGPMMGGPGYGQRYGNPMAMMNLTDDQRQKLFDIQQEARNKQWKRMGEMQEAMAALQQEMAKESPNPDTVSKAYDRVSAIRGEMMRHGLETRQQMMQTLNKEQRQQFRGMMGPGMGMIQ